MPDDILGWNNYSTTNNVFIINKSYVLYNFNILSYWCTRLLSVKITMIVVKACGIQDMDS